MVERLHDLAHNHDDSRSTMKGQRSMVERLHDLAHNHDDSRSTMKGATDHG